MVGIDDWYKNREGQREGLDGWGNDEPLRLEPEDWIPTRARRGRSTQTASRPLVPAPRLTTRAQPKPNSTRRHPDADKALAAAVRREAARCPHWNARRIAEEFRARVGGTVAAETVARLTGRSLGPLPISPPVAHKVGQRRAISSDSASRRLIRKLIAQAKDDGRTPRVAELLADVLAAGGSLSRRQVIAVLSPEQSRPRRKPHRVARAGTVSAVRPAARPTVGNKVLICKSCSGVIRVLGHCRCT